MAFIVRKGTNGPDTFTLSTSQVGTFDIRALGGNDRINLLRNDDLGGGHRVDAGSGNDTVVNRCENGNLILLGPGNDVYVGAPLNISPGVDVVSGNGGNDILAFTTFQSRYLGGPGNDLFISEGWQNVINGEGGADTVSYQDRHLSSVIGDTGVTIELANQKVATGAIRVETIISIENAIGSENGDLIFGTSGANKLSGLGGDDGIDGGAGNDTLEGGLGHDELLGGDGADKFVYTHLSFDSADLVDDFNAAQGDKIELKSGATFGGLSPGAFSFRGVFKSGPSPEPATRNPTLLYDTETGVLSMDVDGTGAKAKVEFIQFLGIPPMQASDFHVF